MLASIKNVYMVNFRFRMAKIKTEFDELLVIADLADLSAGICCWRVSIRPPQAQRFGAYAKTSGNETVALRTDIMGVLGNPDSQCELQEALWWLRPSATALWRGEAQFTHQSCRRVYR